MKKKYILFIILPFLLMCSSQKNEMQLGSGIKKTETNSLLPLSIALKINHVKYKNHILKFEYSIQNASDSTLLIYKPYLEKGIDTGIFKIILTDKNNKSNRFNLIWLKADGSCEKLKLKPIELTLDNAIVVEKGYEYFSSIELDLEKTILSQIPIERRVFLLQYEINYTIPQFFSNLNYNIYTGKIISNEVEIQL